MEKTSTTSFSEMNLNPALLTALEKMAIKTPTEIQTQAIPACFEGKEIIAVAQTGSGKTLAYALPVLTMLAKNPTSRALVLVPSREMAAQIEKVLYQLCAELPISTCIVIGGTPNAKQVSSLKKKPRLIVATPGRMNDHLLTNKLLLQGVEYIVIDEADRMLDIGFAPQLKAIKATLRGKQQTMMFSASFGDSVKSVSKIFMSGPIHTIRSSKAEEPVASLKQKVIFIDGYLKNDRLVQELKVVKGGTIVFCSSQESCERVGSHLREFGYEVDLIHGSLNQGHRNRVVREFRQGELKIIVTTDLLARGLDVPHVDQVINYDLPVEPEDFLHRIGRTARAGRFGTALTFVTPGDGNLYRPIKIYLKDAIEIKLNPKFEFLKKKTFNGNDQDRPVETSIKPVPKTGANQHKRF